MTHHLLTYKNSQISYYLFGRGPDPVVCFHGYGEEASSFDFLEEYAGEKFTFYSIDLPFHGRTTWNEDLDFSVEDLTLIISQLVPQGKTRQVVLMGFSLGARVALSLYQQQIVPVKKILLLAPDGLKVNGWYWLATQTIVGNRIFSFTMTHPAWFFSILKMLNGVRVVNPSIFKFVNHYIADREVRSLLYKRWTSLRKLKPDLELIKRLIRENNTQVRLIYGKHDRIILSSVGKKFMKGIEDQSSISIIHAGHQVLHRKHCDEILPALLH